MSPTVGAVYRHFRNKKSYRIVGIAREVNSLDKVVVYQALYCGEGKIDDYQLWTRPLDKFTGRVWHEYQWVNRFEIEDLIPPP